MQFRKILFPLLVLLNIAAVFAGAYFYSSQLSSTPLPLLLFVPDCPLYVLLALLVILKLVKSDAFSFIVSVGMAKYGLWTLFVLIGFWNYYSLGPLLLQVSAIFIIGHVGMVLEGLALLPKKKISLNIAALALGWFLLNDVLDYFANLHPSVPPGAVAACGIFAFASTLLLVPLLYACSGKIRQLPAILQLREIIGS